MQDLAKLTQLIDTILNAPYPPSLKPLFDYVERLPKAVLQCWVCCKPCQVDSLVTALLHGLETWPYCVRLLYRWAEIKDVRDAILGQSPVVLDQLLKQANHFRDSCDIREACISLLSQPLPRSVALPASVQSFMIAILDEVAHNPATGSLRAAQRMINGMKPLLLDLIPDNILELFLQRCQSILGKKGERDALGDVFVLAIFAVISRTSPPPPSLATLYTNRITQSSPREIFKIANDYVSGKHVYHSLNFIVLQSIMCVSVNRPCGVAEPVESLRLIREVLEAVPQEKRHAPAERLKCHFEKLIQRVTRHDIEPEIQLLGLTVSHQLLSPAPAPVLNASLKLLFLETSVQLDTDDRDALLNVILAKDSGCIQSYLGKFLVGAIDLCSPLGAYTTEVQILRLHAVQRTLRSFQSHLKTSKPLQLTLASLATSQNIPGWWEASSNMPESSHNLYVCHGRPICRFHAKKLRLSVRCDISALILQAIFLAGPGLLTFPDHDVCVKLINNLRSAAVLLEPARWRRNIRSNEDTISKLQLTEIVPQSGTIEREFSLDWRIITRWILQKMFDVGADTLIQQFSSVCRDVEDRAKSIDVPLPAEQEKADRPIYAKAVSTDMHEHQIALLNSKCGQSVKEPGRELRSLSTLAERKTEVNCERDHLTGALPDGLKDATEQYRQARATISTIHGSKERLTQVQKVAKVEIISKRELENAVAQREKAEQAALNLRIGKDVLIADYQLMLQSAKSKQEALEQDIGSLKNYLEDSTAALKGEITAAAAIVERFIHAYAKLEADFSSAQRQRDALATKLESTKNENERLVERIDSLTSLELDLKAHNAALGNEVWEANERCDELSVRVVDLAAKTNGLEQALTKEEEKNKILNKEAVTFERKLEGQRKELESLRKERSILRETVEERNREIEKGWKLRQKMKGLLEDLGASQTKEQENEREYGNAVEADSNATSSSSSEEEMQKRGDKHGENTFGRQPLQILVADHQNVKEKEGKAALIATPGPGKASMLLTSWTPISPDRYDTGLDMNKGDMKGNDLWTPEENPQDTSLVVDPQQDCEAGDGIVNESGEGIEVEMDVTTWSMSPF
ncbi:MAG: hypothetical protein Q9227_001659 [Pyrenula ochraceoflavens]